MKMAKQESVLQVAEIWGTLVGISDIFRTSIEGLKQKSAGEVLKCARIIAEDNSLWELFPDSVQGPSSKVGKRKLRDSLKCALKELEQ
jgi:hypothetical protein